MSIPGYQVKELQYDQWDVDQAYAHGRRAGIVNSIHVAVVVTIFIVTLTLIFG